MSVSLRPKMQELAGLEPKEAGLDGTGATQSPQDARQSEDQFSFDSRLRVIVGCHRHFESRIVFGIFQRIDHGFCSQPMT